MGQHQAGLWGPQLVRVQHAAENVSLHLLRGGTGEELCEGSRMCERTMVCGGEGCVCVQRKMSRSTSCARVQQQCEEELVSLPIV